MAEANYLDIARAGYEAYAKQTGGKTHDGRPMPRWFDLPNRTTDAWMEAARAIVNSALGDLQAENDRLRRLLPMVKDGL